MKYGYTIIYVKDVLETIAFYENAFGFECGVVVEEGGIVYYAELKSGETTLAFASYEMGKMNFDDKYEKVTPKGNPIGIELVFVDADVEASTNRAVEAGAELISKPTEKPWGQMVSYVRSMEGTLIEICSPMGEG